MHQRNNSRVASTQEEHDMLHRPKFDWSYNFGHVLQTVALIVTVGGGVWYQSSVQAEMRKDIEAAKQRALIYGPRVDELMRSNGIQDERIGNLAEAIKDFRKTNAEVLTAISGIREDMATVKAKINSRP